MTLKIMKQQHENANGEVWFHLHAFDYVNVCDQHEFLMELQLKCQAKMKNTDLNVCAEHIKFIICRMIYASEVLLSNVSILLLQKTAVSSHYNKCNTVGVNSESCGKPAEY